MWKFEKQIKFQMMQFPAISNCHEGISSLQVLPLQ